MEEKSREYIREKYKTILLDDNNICIEKMWLYDIARKIGFDFDKPEDVFIDNQGYGRECIVYRLGDTPICLVISNESIICTRPPKISKGSEMYLEYYFFRLCRNWVGVHSGTSDSTLKEEMLFIDLVNELLTCSGCDTINPEDYLPDSIDSLIDIVNGDNGVQ